MQPLVRAATAFAILHDAAGGVHHHVLKKNEDEIVTFDHKVLGNLQGAAELEDLQLPHKHIFTAQISVGTPPQTMECLLDSGSADLWLPSKRCEHCTGEHHFKADDSSSFMPAVIRTPDGLMPVLVQASYNTGDVVGFLVQDHISIGQHRFVNQSFIIVEEEDLPPQRDWDGVCGLGFKTLTDAGRPLYLNVHESEEPIFALIPKGLGPGSTTFLTVGGLPKDSLDMHSLSYAPAVPLMPGSEKSYWVAKGKVNVNEEPLMGARFLIDTANAYIMAPRNIFKNVVSSLLPDNIFQESCGVDKSAGGLVVCDCAKTQDNRALADRKLTIHMGERNYWIRLTHLFKQVPAQDAGARKLCLLLVQPAPLAAMSFDPLEVLASLLAAQDSSGKKQGKDGEHTAEMLAPFLLPGSVVGSPHPQESRRLQRQPDPLEDVWVLGGVFLERFSVVFDFKENRLGIALATDRESAEMAEARTMAAGGTSHVEGGSWLPTMALSALVGGGAYFAWSYFKKFQTRKNFAGGAANAHAGESSDEVAGGPEDMALAE